MLLAPPLGEPPRDGGRAPGRGARASGSATTLERVEVAGPGFLNLFMSDAWYRDALAAVVDAGDGVRRRPAPSRASACSSSS